MPKKKYGGNLSGFISWSILIFQSFVVQLASPHHTEMDNACIYFSDLALFSNFTRKCICNGIQQFTFNELICEFWTTSSTLIFAGKKLFACTS